MTQISQESIFGTIRKIEAGRRWPSCVPPVGARAGTCRAVSSAACLFTSLSPTDHTFLLEHTTGLKILVTSQATLHVAGEHIWTVPPLAFRDMRDLPSLDVLARYPAIQLFLQQAQAVQQDFVVTETNALVVAAICAQLKGVPLAIELAATHFAVEHNLV